MASLPDDNRFLLLKGLRQTLHLSDQDEKTASSEEPTPLSDPDAQGDTSDETQKLQRRSDRARATSAVGLGCHMDLDSAVLLPAKLETLGKALAAALDEAADARPAFKALVEEGYSSAATAPVTSQFILRSFANDLSSLSKLVSSETLLAELRQGTSLLSQAMALRWDLTGETRALQQLANAFVASKSELTNATAAEFGLALATAIALSQPEVTDRLLAFASEHIADDADPGLVRDALHCMDAGRLLQTMPAVIQSVWQQRLRFADRNWNWDTTESRRVLNSLARVIRPDSLSLPLFKRIVPDELWAKMFSQSEAFSVEPSPSTGEDPPSEEFRIEEATPVPAAEPVAEKKPEHEVKSEPAGAPPTQNEQPEAKKVDPTAEQASAADKPAASTSKPEPEVATPPPAAETQPAKSAEPKPTPAPEAPKDSKPEKEAEKPAQPAKPVSDASAAPAAAAAPPAKASSPAPKAKLEPTTDPVPKTDPLPATAAPAAEKPAARSGFLTFVAGAVGGLLVAFALWSALPPKLQTLASAAAIEPEPTSPAALSPAAPPQNAKPVAPPSTPAPVVAPTPVPASPAPAVVSHPVVVPETPPSPPKTIASAPPAPTPTPAPKAKPPVPVVPTPAKPAPEPNKPAVVKTEPAKVPSTPSAPTPPAPPPASPKPANETQPPAVPKPQPAPVMAVAPSKPAPAPEAKKEAPAPEPKKSEAALAPVSKPDEMVGPPQAAAPNVAEVKPTPPPPPTPAPAPTPPAPQPVAPPPAVVSKPQAAPTFDIWKQKRVVELLSQHPSMKDWAFTAQNRSLRDSTHLILGKHPLIPHKSPVHQSLLTLLVLDPPKDPDAARASLTMFSRVCPPSLCLEVWEPMVEAKVPQTDDIRRAAGVMVELMSIQLSAATRQRLERLAHGK